MSNAYVIEVRSAAAGLVVRERGGFRFFSATNDFAGLEGRSFRNPQEAEKAAIRHAALRGAKTGPRFA
jgi:hypothetical protein